jgi:hypothetical protein
MLLAAPSTVTESGTGLLPDNTVAEGSVTLT